MVAQLIAKKIGMTQEFCPETGRRIPLSVVQALPNTLMQVIEGDYHAVKLAVGAVRADKLSKAQAGQFAKYDVAPAKQVRELRIDASEVEQYKEKQSLAVTDFSAGEFVNVQGKVRGKGYAGVVKRHNFSTQRMSHGNSKAHRAPGSIGMCQTPGRVFKNKKMSGHMGNVPRTIENLKIHRIDEERGLMLIEGAVPGAPGTQLLVFSSTKKQKS